MADRDAVENALLERIHEATTRGHNPSLIRELAEAYAWIVAPAQPHSPPEIR